MLKTGSNYHYSTLTDSSKSKEYKISPNDIVEFSIYTNNGFKLIDLTSLNNSNSGIRLLNTLEYLVEIDGYCKLPIIGRTKLSGLTIHETELMLEEKYSAYYKEPFVLLSVNNKRIIIFPGSAGDARVIQLRNNNTTLIEAIALAGGIADDGKARQVKLIRQNGDNHDVFLIDLSKIEGIREASMIVQANDIIYIEPRKKISTRLVQELVPIVSLIINLYVILTYSTYIAKK